ncbi:MAG: response regulator [Bacteroidota bacterium]|nr:response regulator [Bacteroidota bacterium]
MNKTPSMMLTTQVSVAKSGASAIPGAANRSSILLADDDRDDCNFFKDALDELPVTAALTTVRDGEQLMKVLAEVAIAPPSPYVLFLDLNMPRKNGYDCLAEIKLDERLRRIPVIIFSTSYDPRVVDLLYTVGADYYIRKPADFAELKKVIYQALVLATKGYSSQPLKEDFVLKGELGTIQQ